MSKALRGDFERLRERGISATLYPPETQTPVPEPVEAAAAPVESPPEPAVERPEALSAAREPEPVPEPETSGEREASEEPDTSQPGWFGRMFGR